MSLCGNTDNAAGLACDKDAGHDREHSRGDHAWGSCQPIPSRVFDDETSRALERYRPMSTREGGR